MINDKLLLIPSGGGGKPIGKPIIKSASVYCYNEQLDIRESSFDETGGISTEAKLCSDSGGNNVLYQWASEYNSASFLIYQFPEASKIQFVGKYLFIRHLGPRGTASEWSDGVKVVQGSINEWCAY